LTEMLLAAVVVVVEEINLNLLQQLDYLMLD
jgi:hypothetical protein